MWHPPIGSGAGHVFAWPTINSLQGTFCSLGGKGGHDIIRPAVAHLQAAALHHVLLLAETSWGVREEPRGHPRPTFQNDTSPGSSSLATDPPHSTFFGRGWKMNRPSERTAMLLGCLTVVSSRIVKRRYCT